MGKELLAILLHDAHARLKPGGQLYVVTINGLREFMKRNLKEVLGNYDKLKQGAHYTVGMAQRGESGRDVGAGFKPAPTGYQMTVDRLSVRKLALAYSRGHLCKLSRSSVAPLTASRNVYGP